MKMKKVEVTPWQPAWQQQFEQLRATLQLHLEGLICAIEHVGSTSVPGLAAKPILDVDVVIPNREVFEQVKTKLEELGYFHRGDLGVRGREAFGYNQKPDLMRHHLYVLVQQSDELKRQLGFRDWLRAHPQDAADYASVKLEAARRYPNDIEAYLEVKSDFIQQIYQQAGLVDAADVFSNAWSVLINRYGMNVTSLICQQIEPGLNGCEVTTDERAYYLLAWENMFPLDKFEDANQPIPTVTGKAICNLTQLNFALFENQEKAMHYYLRRRTKNG